MLKLPIKSNVIINLISYNMLLCFLFFSCQKKEKHIEGRKLAENYCSTCHLFPSASILPRKIWGEKVIPSMGSKMGMSHGPIYSYGKPESGVNLIPSMSQDEWNKIVYYYLNESENSIPKYEIKDTEASTLFKPHISLINSSPLVSMISFNEEQQKLFLGDANSSSLLTIDSEGNIIGKEKLSSPPVKIIFKDSLRYLLTIGNLNPSDAAKGIIMIGEQVIDNLTRPVDFFIKDITMDGYDDILICNYGNNIGDFSLYENSKNGTYKKKIIQPLSGAIKVEIANIDNDDENEIVVLFAQEHEQILIFDYHNGAFHEKKAYQFQPAFGSVDFQLKDINSDDLVDIIIGNGDNSDLSTVIKNFHGIRVFLNKGDNNYIESYFHPMHGVSKVVAEDFDLDGDVDILAISNFGDFTNPKFKAVQLLLNQGNMVFKPKHINGLDNFRWQTIDISDYDKDGDLDIFLGSFNLNLGPKESDISDKKNITWVRLENLVKR